jgi:hypothetical protein
METARESMLDAWPVSWSAVWVGALAALVTALIIGTVGYAAGAHELSTRRINWSAVRWLSIVFSVAGAFFSFVVGGWVAARIAGFHRAEPAMLHGAIAWLVAVPILLAIGALGGLTMFGTWYGGLAAVPSNAAAVAATVDREAAAAVRNGAIAAGVSILLGLVGSVLGGWMASGEEMRLGGRRRELETTDRPRRRVA